VAGPRIRLLRREDCPLCDQAEAVLRDLDAPLQLELQDVDEDPELRRSYGDRVPVALHAGEELFDLEAGPEEIRAAVEPLAEGS
jgi:hypothetical protein